MRYAFGLAAAAVVIGFPSLLLAAPAVDDAGRIDLREARVREPSLRAEAGPAFAANVTGEENPISWDVSLGGTYTSNAGLVHSDPLATGYATPGLKFSVKPASSGPWSTAFSLAYDGDYFLNKHRDYAESRVDARLVLSRKLGSGTLALNLRAFESYTADFDDENYDLQVVGLSYAWKTAKTTFKVSGESHSSKLAALRRTRWGATANHTFDKKAGAYELSVTGAVAASNFTAGSNDGRTDVQTQAIFAAARPIGAQGWNLEWDLSLTHRFSNRTRSRFDEVSIGPVLSRTF